MKNDKPLESEHRPHQTLYNNIVVVIIFVVYQLYTARQ